MNRYDEVTIVSYTLWWSRLHGDAGTLRTKILFDRKPYIVIGVMPRDFELPWWRVEGHLKQQGVVGFPSAMNSDPLDYDRRRAEHEDHGVRNSAVIV